jgi:hypothetical protein
VALGQSFSVRSHCKGKFLSDVSAFPDHRPNQRHGVAREREVTSTSRDAPSQAIRLRIAGTGMQYFRALATDYDGTIAHDGVVHNQRPAALEKLKQSLLVFADPGR